MQRIRIKGLVSLMNRTRIQLVNGIPSSEIQAFKKMVLDTTAFIEGVCRDHGVPLSDLPAPTRRAYEYLKRIDLDHLPNRREQDVQSVSGIRISNIVSSCRMIQKEFLELTRKRIDGRKNEKDLEKRLSTLHDHIQRLAAMVDEICEKMGAIPDRLPDPTRRAYQWLKFLSDHGNFDDHLRTLTKISRRVPDGHVELYNIIGLYRVQHKEGRRNIVINEAFLCAPRSVVRDLITILVSAGGESARSHIKRYADSEEFRETLLSIEMIGIELEGRTRGERYDLEEVFKRVNDGYFEGQMEKPILTWNKMITHRKFGHYVPSTDTLMISIVLDSPEVPSYVIDHVMHHELLHKKLGSRLLNGRRLAHTSEFREEERQFKHYQRAQTFLARMSKELLSG